MESSNSKPLELQNRSIFAKSKLSVTLKFEDVEYKIKTKAQKKKQKKMLPERKILKGITGIVRPGEMLALMGPSGSGKTTLLTALGGRLTTGHLTGHISYNDKPLSNPMKRNIGFVTQDDYLHPHLTVTETLVYTALLRLPKTLTKLEKIKHAESVMAELGLDTCKDSIIGGPFLRGVSGGERKRVSIGQEMLVNPGLLFLDEPTSGLDSTTAGKIVGILGELTKGGRTVVMTIHQPSSRLFYMFHKVLLLSDGSTMYFGKGQEVMEYFELVGYKPDVPMNPADFLLDLANGVSTNETFENKADVKEDLIAAYKTNLHSKVNAELQGSGNQLVESEPDQKFINQWATTWLDQFKVLLERGLKERRHESFSGLKIFQVLVVALVCGVLWWRSHPHAQDQIGLLFFMSGFWGFFPLFQAIFTFPDERTMLTKERTSRMYKLSSYYISRLVGDLPMELILPTVFVTIVYWMSGLNPTASNFFATLAVMLLSVLVAQGLGLALGALIMNMKSATTLASVIMLTFMLAGGYYVQNVPKFIGWIRYVSLSYYSFKLLVVSQFDENDVYQCGQGLECRVADLPSVKIVGFGWTGVAVAVMFVMLVFYRVVAYLALMRIGVTR